MSTFYDFYDTITKIFGAWLELYGCHAHLLCSKKWSLSCDLLRFLTILHQQDDQDSNSGPFKLSKWELMDKENKMGKLVQFDSDKFLIHFFPRRVSRLRD